MTTAIPVILKDTAGNYVLPQSYQIKATAETLGSIRVGSGLNMANDGVLSTTATTMTGATSSSAGTSGFVPAPAAGDQDKFLKGDGTYATVNTSPTFAYNSSTETLTIS